MDLDIQLDKEQKRTVECFHHLIYETLNSMNLDVDMWYDVAALGLCEGVIDKKDTYDELRDAIVSAVLDEQYRIKSNEDIYDNYIKTSASNYF